MAGLRFLPKQLLVVLTEAADVSVGTIAQGTILVMEEVTTKVVLGRTNALELVVVQIRLK